MRLLSGRTRAARACARRTLLAALASLAAGCADDTPSGPAGGRLRGAPIAVTPPPPPPVPPAPTITGPAVLYERASPSAFGMIDAYLLSSGADSAFAIIFPGGTSHWGWSGRYAREDSVLVFHYNAWSAAGELAARGTIRGDSLVLRYNAVMQMTDFEDGVYVRAARGQ
jgi:hypothetical protein